MPRYFFHVEDHPSVCDDEGIELESVTLARSQALRFAGEFLAEAPVEAVLDHQTIRVRVANEDGETVLAVEVRDVTPKKVAGASLTLRASRR